MAGGAGIMMFQPGQPCCEVECPDCTAPTPVTTGSSSANSAWYLTDEDTNGDRASFHAVNLTGTEPDGISDWSAFFTWSWYKLRSYFAWADEDNHAFAELWDVVTRISGQYVHTYHSRVVEMTDGSETELASHTFPALWSLDPNNVGIAVCYDEATNIARVVCWASGTTVYDKFMSYDYLSLTQDPAKGVYYGWGVGSIAGTPSPSDISLIKATRHINYCQSFPHLLISGTAFDFGNYPWYKSTLPETLHLEIDGVTCGGTQACTNCGALNDEFDLTRNAIDQIWQFATSAATTQLPYSSPEIDAGCVDTFSWNWKIQYRLAASGTLVTLYAIAYGYSASGKFWSPYILAYCSKTIAHGDCFGYDGANAVDGLVFDDWVNVNSAGDDVLIIRNGFPPAIVITFPDFRSATATITLP